MTKQVTLVRVNTLADGTIRLTLDLLNGSDKDIAEAFKLINKDATLMLCDSDKLVEEIHELAEQLLNG